MPKIVKAGEFKDYTLIENACLRDKAIDIAERGLLVTMLSLPDNWDFNGVGLSSILPCGKTKVYNTLNKLEAAGYLKRKRIYRNGKVSDWEYHICGRPIFREENSEESTDKDSASENSTSNDNTAKNNMPQNKAVNINSNVDNPVDNYVDNSKNIKNAFQADNDNFSGNSDNPAHNSVFSENLFPENLKIGFQKIENLKIGNLKTEKPDNNKILNNQVCNNQIYNNQSIHQSNSPQNKPNGENRILLKDKVTDGRKTDRIDRLNYLQHQSEKTINDYEIYKKIIKHNIAFDDLCNSVKPGDVKLLSEIIDIMTEIVTFNKNSLKINGNEVPAEVVKSRFLKINYDDLQYVLETFSKNTTRIINIRAYLITMIYNAKSTINSYYKAEVQHDFYGYD